MRLIKQANEKQAHTLVFCLERLFPTCEQAWQLQLKFIEHLLYTRQSSKPSGVSIP